MSVVMSDSSAATPATPPGPFLLRQDLELEEQQEDDVPGGGVVVGVSLDATSLLRSCCCCRLPLLYQTDEAVLPLSLKVVRDNKGMSLACLSHRSHRTA